MVTLRDSIELRIHLANLEMYEALPNDTARLVI